MSAAADFSNFPFSVDVDLHPEQQATLPPGQTIVSQFELDSLYKTHQTTCTDLEVYKERSEKLQRDIDTEKIKSDNLQRALDLTKAHFNEAINEKELLQSHNETLESNLADEKFKSGNLQCGLDLNKDHLDEAIRANDQLQGQIEKLEFDFKRKERLACETAHDLQSHIKKLEEDLVAEKLITENPQCDLVVENDQFSNSWIVAVENENKRYTEFEFKTAVLNKEFEVTQKFKNSFDELTEVYKNVCTKKKDLEKRNNVLSEQLRMFSEKVTGEDVDIKEIHRFKVKRRQVECSVCHESFGSTMEMEQTECHYHKCARPVHLEGSCTGKVWICCRQEVKGNRAVLGCQPGKHRLSTTAKRLREE